MKNSESRRPGRLLRVVVAAAAVAGATFAVTPRTTAALVPASKTVASNPSSESQSESSMRVCYKYYYVNTSGVNRRQGPGTTYTIAGVSNQGWLCGPGYEVQTNDGSSGCSTGWWAVIDYFGDQQYVCSAYVDY